MMNQATTTQDPLALAGLSVTRPATAPIDGRPISGIAKCMRCKSAKRVEGYVRRTYAGYGRYTATESWPTVVCSCGRAYPMISRIKAITTDHKCDSRCTSAKGHNCECSCGGKNHGSNL